MVSALVLAAAVLAQQQTVATLVKRIDSIALHQSFSGVVMVGQSENVVFAQAYGTHTSLETKYVTASVAQTFIAATVALLARDGKIAYDAPLSRYLPDSIYPRERADRMTIRQLLTHTAGLGPGVVRLPQFRSAPRSYSSFHQLLALVRAQPLAGDTGHFAYTGADCELLAAVIERVTGKSYVNAVSNGVFAWANMSESGFDFSPTAGDLANRSAMLPSIGVPEAVAYTDAHDLLVFGYRLLEEPLPGLFSDTVTTGQDGPNHAYGYGFFVGKAGVNRIFNHGGTGPGIDNAFDIYPDLRVVVVILSNQDPPAAQNIRQYLRDGLSQR